jgi:hypothetical protein
VTKSNKDRPKLCSLGYYYIVERPTKTINFEGTQLILNNLCFIFTIINKGLRITWKCEKKSCKGRGHSNGLEPPFQLSQLHNHLPDPVRCKVLKSEEKMKTDVEVSNDPVRSIIRDGNKESDEEAASKARSISSLTQMLNRKKAEKNEVIQAFDTPLCDLFIPEGLQKTYLNQVFYWDDSGRSDDTRVILFTTEANLRLMQSHRDWLVDGTFDLAPKRVFKQVYTIHIIYKNKGLPLVYGLLPNKTLKKHTKSFLKWLKM